ncbi:MAG: bifunctional 5,10-methylenetetrahydrofolate dehydrogenase/5,10-methenyltetrahydrofolate cyclohydrolase [Thermoplasmata archaeon]
MAEIIDGKLISNEMETILKNEVESYYSKTGLRPSLNTILIGGDDVARLYAKSKIKFAQRVGMTGYINVLDEKAELGTVLELIDRLNKDPDVHGIMVEMPIPLRLDKAKIMQRITPEKDIDGMNPLNYGKLLLGNEDFAPSTPKAVIKILDHINVKFEGSEVCIINASNIVGKPLSLMLLNREATVTVCHIKTRSVKEHSIEADIVVVAAGKPNLLTEDMVSKDAIVIDVGINNVNGKIVGDADFENVSKKVRKITPVPGGVGSVTTITILENTFNAFKKQMEK